MVIDNHITKHDGEQQSLNIQLLRAAMVVSGTAEIAFEEGGTLKVYFRIQNTLVIGIDNVQAGRSPAQALHETIRRSFTRIRKYSRRHY